MVISNKENLDQHPQIEELEHQLKSILNKKDIQGHILKQESNLHPVIVDSILQQ
jgi:hypothetical protein